MLSASLFINAVRKRQYPLSIIVAILIQLHHANQIAQIKAVHLYKYNIYIYINIYIPHYPQSFQFKPKQQKNNIKKKQDLPLSSLTPSRFARLPLQRLHRGFVASPAVLSPEVASLGFLEHRSDLIKFQGLVLLFFVWKDFEMRYLLLFIMIYWYLLLLQFPLETGKS